MTAQTPWPAQWLRGPLPLCVLQVVKQQPAHGYAITAELERLGLGALGGGTLYPILGRLQRDGFLTAEWTAGEGGPGRKVYELTEAGLVELRVKAAQWQQFAQVVSKVLPEHIEAGGIQ